MELKQAEELANQLMKQHGIIEQGWRFKFDRSLRRLGCCHYSSRRITLSAKITLLNEVSKIKDVILHEIADALVGHKHGHDWVWQRKAMEIGCDGLRCSNDHVKTLSKYIGTCPNGHEHPAHKLKRKPVSCGKCSRVYDTRFLIVYKER